jgi:hypothetical protein
MYFLLITNYPISPKIKDESEKLKWIHKNFQSGLTLKTGEV